MSRIPELEAQLVAAARRRTRRPRVARGTRAVGVAFAGAAVLATAAAAATGLLPIGTQVPTPQERQGDGLLYTEPRTIVATGTAPEAGRWEMSITDSDVGPCLGFRRLDDPVGGALGEGCGNTSTFTVASSSNGFPMNQPEKANRWKLVFGNAPERAEIVRVTAAGGFQRSAKTYEGPAGYDGDFYLLELPGKLKRARVTAVGKDGNPLGPGLDVG